MKTSNNYQVIVVGGGHAGIEAALACARKGHKTLMITLNKKMIGNMPCNPSIGGPAKGVVVREIDALGGEMAKASDQTYMQMKLLNYSKGPGVWALRAQSDKVKYPKYMQTVISKQKNLTVIEDMVTEIEVHNNIVKGVKTSKHGSIKSHSIILTTGTYLESKILVGKDVKIAGPDGEAAAIGLSESLKKLGHKLFRLKTGTPPRVSSKSIDWSLTQEEPGTDAPLAFSFQTKKFIPFNKQWPCHLIYTNEKTHEIIRKNINKASMYCGVISGTGPRYCPSVEDKVMRFKDKERHQLFLEPETASNNSIYVQGFSSSMPVDVQDKMLRTIPSLKNAEVIRYAYAIEYDAVDVRDMKMTLESKLVENLYCAGQINGTSGYEEAACQGLMAGINASLKIENKEPLILKRSEAYIGVLIDDLITKGVDDPYRLLTSRAEYRLAIRHDNAEERLMKYGYKIGLIKKNVYQKLLKMQDNVVKEKELMKKTILSPKNELTKFLNEKNISKITTGISIYNLLKRPEITYKLIKKYLPYKTLLKTEWEIQNLEIFTKFEGYIKKQSDQINRFQKWELIKLDSNIDYQKVPNIALEAREKLNRVKPINVGQASRISGVNPADITMLMLYLKQRGIK